jgi:hypothetical protein
MLAVRPPPIACALVPELVEDDRRRTSRGGITGYSRRGGHPFLAGELQRRTGGASIDQSGVA